MRMIILAGFVLASFTISWFAGIRESAPSIDMYAKNTWIKVENLMRNKSEGNSTKKETTNVTVIPSTGTGIFGISMGQSSEAVIKELGQPDRKDKNNLGYEWWVYNRDLSHYVQIGIKNGTVTDVYSNAPTWNFRGIQAGSSKNTLRNTLFYQEQVDLPNENGKVTIRNTNDEYELYMVNNIPVIFYFDKYKNKQVTAIRWISHESLTVGNFFNRSSTYSVHSISLEKHPLSAEDQLAVEKGTELEILDITNVYRLREGLSPLTWNQAASRIAKAHSQDMLQHKFFEHRSQTTGLDPFERMKKAGIAFSAAGENIAAGQEDGAAVVEGWMNSIGHRTNILNREFSTLGVGVYRNHYTQDFVTP